ncbi:MAG: KH domain-containing protein [archaeon]
MDEILKTSKDRISIIIGHNGQTKYDIEKKTKTSLDINSENGEITITTNKSYFEIHLAKKIITAISRGFSPEHAFKLLNDDYALEIFNLTDYTAKSDERIMQIKGRVIGRAGRIKGLIEKKNNCIISVYGKTVAVIVNYEKLDAVKRIIESLLRGGRHSTVFKMIKNNERGSSDSKAVDDITFD